MSVCVQTELTDTAVDGDLTPTEVVICTHILTVPQSPTTLPGNTELSVSPCLPEV